MKYSPTNKERKKVIRTIIEAVILVGIFIFVARALFVFKEYTPYEKDDKSIVTGEDNGFIAISYLAVAREGTDTMISTDRLKEHLDALHRNGYITITQEDIDNYYKKGIPLPKKSLFLMFEDGRRDTAIFSQKIMEKYNFIGTMLSYADKFIHTDTKFLQPKDLLELKKSTFWELGTNGYRLSYINVFDRYDNYLGELSSLEYSSINQYLERNYNQYLMDFIRDENSIPKETYSQMASRIRKDYQMMDEIYTKKMGEVPGAYVLMHSNTGSYANNEKVSAINELSMKELFTMNFNREGSSFNNDKNDIFDLTRMQPQPYWYPNHLLMRIADDTSADIEFVEGDIIRKKDWDILNGVAEYRDSIIALTSESEGNGLMRLKESKDYQNYKLSVTLTGNKLGTQTIYLRADEEQKEYVAVKIQNNNLYIEENGKPIYKLDLNEHDGLVMQSIEENQKEAREAEYELYSNQNGRFGNTTNMNEQTKESLIKEVRTVEDGAKEYIPPIQISDPGNREVEIILQDENLSVTIDKKKAVENLTLSGKSKGYIYLESAWGEYGYSQRNIADDVYDGVFENLVIRNIEDNSILFDNQLHGLDKAIFNVNTTWNHIINWFINTL